MLCGCYKDDEDEEVDDNSTWHAINTGHINFTKETWSNLS